MAAGCDYHSPQFSEDINWLPAWLQPHHQLPHLGDSARDEQAASLDACQNQASFQENASSGQVGRLFTNYDAKYSGCHLYLSGSENLPAGTSPSGQALQFCLQFSSTSVSQSSPGQFTDLPQIGRCETNEDSIRKPQKIPEVHNETISEYKIVNDSPELESPGGCKSRLSPVLISHPLIQGDSSNPRGFHKHLEVGNLKSANKKLKVADIDNAVELSIAASEAIVISEMVSSSTPSEILPAEAILEIALRVKQARNQCYTDILEANSIFSTNELDETDRLSDLDEGIMSDVFHDVGLSVTHASPGHCGWKGDAQRKRLKNRDADISTTITQTNDFANELKAKNLPLEQFPLQQTGSPAVVPIGSTACLRNQSMAHTEKSIKRADDLTVIQMDPKDDQDVLKESKMTPDRDPNLRISIKGLFNGEASFLSESMDTNDQCPSEQRHEPELDIVASSSTPFKDLAKCPYKESEGSIHEGTVSSQEVVRSSILSLVDPLCSMVPCSISLHNDPLKETEENGEKLMHPTATPEDQDTLPLKPLDQGGDCVLSKISTEGHGVPKRKHFNSLKPFSMVISCQETAGETGERNNSDIGRLIHSNEERCSPLILGNKKRRLQACRIILNGEDEALRKFSAPNTGKYGAEHSNEVICRDQIIITSCDPQQSKGSLEKKVQFIEPKNSVDRSTRIGGRLRSGYKTSLPRRTRSRVESCLHYESASGKEIHNSLIFQGLDFLLTGFSSKKEKELEEIIRTYGGYVLSTIPSLLPDLKGKRMGAVCLKFPIVLSPKKVQTTKFLYGCATSAWILNADWLVNSVHAGSLLPPDKYTIRPIQASGRKSLRITEPICFNNHTFIFDRAGIMLYGKPSFYTKFSKIIKHGGGQVFKSLQRLVQSMKNGKNLVGTIVVENEHNVSRHLKHCALEHSLQTVSSSWIVNSLFSGKLLPFKKDRCALLHRIKMPTFCRAQIMDMSQEI